MSTTADDHKMSDAEALMWRLENDPRLASTFGAVTILDRAPDIDVFRRRLEHATLRMPRLRQRVDASPGNVSAPHWVDDADFDVDSHVRHIALPKPGTERQLFDLAALICADPFDRSRPLWQFTVVEGLRGKRAAIVQKLHHTIADGERGVQLALGYLDTERDALQPSSPTPDEIAAARSDTRDADIRAADAVRDVLAGGLRVPLGIAKQVRELLADPSQIPDASSAAADTMRSLVDQIGDTSPARSPIWTARSRRRRLDHISVAVEATKTAATHLGGTLNTAFMTIAAEAAAGYHDELGSPVESLRTSLAISTRTDDSGANAFSLARLDVPTGPMPIDERFRAVAEATAAALEAHAHTSIESLAPLASTLPTAMLTRLARQQARTIDFATSNVRGAPIPLYVAGARLLHNVPLGPLGGVAFNLTLLSYVDHLDMGLHSDAAAITHPDLLVRCLRDAADSFVRFAR